MVDREEHRRKARMSRRQIETALITAGKQLLEERGVEPGLGEVTLNEAIAISGVPRASAYRAFADPRLSPQKAFRSELLTEYLGTDPLLEAGSTAAGLADRLTKRCQEARSSGQAHLDGPAAEDLSPEEVAAQARAVLADRRREGSITASSAWHVLGPMWVVAGVDDRPDDKPDDRPDAEVGDAVGAAVETMVQDKVEPDLRSYCQRLGLRPRVGMDWNALALMVFVTSAISSLHESINPKLRDVSRPVGPGGQAERWSQSGLMIEGLLLTCLEPDPDADQAVDLSDWLAPGWHEQFAPRP